VRLWAQVREQRGIEGRDGVWRHPDLIPTADDLADPTSLAGGHRGPRGLKEVLSTAGA
jgi:hypothetical protein